MGQEWSGERGAEESAQPGNRASGATDRRELPRRRGRSKRSSKSENAVRGERRVESRGASRVGRIESDDSNADSSLAAGGPGHDRPGGGRSKDDAPIRRKWRARGRRSGAGVDGADRRQDRPGRPSRAAFVTKSAYRPELRARSSARAIDRALSEREEPASCSPVSPASPAVDPTHTVTPPHASPLPSAPLPPACPREGALLTNADVAGFTARAGAALARGCPEEGGEWCREVEEGVLDGRGFVRVFMRPVGRGGIREVLAVCDLPACAHGAWAALWHFSEYMQWDHHFTRMRTCARIPAGQGWPAQRRDHVVAKSLPFPLNHVVAPRDFVIAQAALRVSVGAGPDALAIIMKDSPGPGAPAPPRGHVRAHLVGVGGMLIARDSADSGRCRMVMSQCVDMCGAVPPAVVALVLRHTPPRWATRLVRYVQQRQQRKQEGEEGMPVPSVQCSV